MDTYNINIIIMEISKEEKLRILNLHESYKECHGTIIKEQYQPDNSGGGELERAPGSKKSNSTGCQLAGKSVNEQTIGNGSGFVDNQGKSASLDKFTRRQQEMSEEGFDPESKYGIPGTEGGHQVDPDRDKKMTAKELTLAILKALGKENDPVQSIIEAVIEKQFQMREMECKWCV